MGAAISLDPDQRAAVAHGAGPCLVLAGPGSGKTRVIVERFLRLCGDGVAPTEQLVLTYTHRAAAEMRERAEIAYGPLPDTTPLTTYHSFAQNMIREWGWLVGISAGFHIANSAERWLHVEAVLHELKPTTLWNPLRPHDLVASILDVIKTAKQELVTPDTYVRWAQRRLDEHPDESQRSLLKRHAECARVYAALQERYRRHSVLDFEDAILYSETLVRAHPAARESICGRVRHLMVDEFQDTDFAQSRLIDALVAGHRNIFVVADDDQSIYKFRGASRANLDRFEAAHPDRVKLILSRNYRSTNQIVDASRLLIGGADPRSRIEKGLTSQRGNGEAVEIWEADSERAEMHAIARECRRLISTGTPPSDVAVLFRRHLDMAAAIDALRECQVPFQVHGGRGFFRQPEIKDALALLTAAADPEHTQSLLRCLLLPSWRVSAPGRRALVDACAAHNQPLVGVVETGGVEGLSEPDLEAARHCVGTVLELNLAAAREDVREVFQAGLEASRFLSILDFQTSAERMQCGANLNKFGELLETFAEWSDDRRTATALHYLNALRNSGDADELPATDRVEEGVVLVTAHSSKGLEWPVIFLADCFEGRWPGRGGGWSRLTLPDELVPEQAPAGDTITDEERRLFYVAATRARDRLIFTHARRYPTSFKGKDEQRTRFLSGLAGVENPPTLVQVPAAPEIEVRGKRQGGRSEIDRLAVTVSALRDFRACPRRYQYAHEYRMPAPYSPQRWYGQLVHGVLQSAAIQRNTGVLIDGDGITGMWSAAWDAVPGRKGNPPELRRLGEEQLRRYVESPAWTEASITEIEQPFVLRTTTADIRGRFDRVDRPELGSPVIVDYKTGPPQPADLEAKDLQVRAYATALSQRDGLDGVAVELHRLQTAEVTRVALGTSDMDRAFKQLSAITAELAEATRHHDFPTKASSWSCGRCDFRTVCDEGRRAATRAGGA